MSNAYTLLIIYATIDLTPWYIEFLYCLLVVEEVTDQFKMKIGKLNGDLLQPSETRYEVWSFSVRNLLSIAYWKRLISGVKLSVVVPQAIGISLRNSGAKLLIYTFGREDVRCLSLLLMILVHSTSDGKHISFPLLYYVDPLVHRPRCIKWFPIFLRQICYALDRCRAVINRRYKLCFD